MNCANNCKGVNPNSVIIGGGAALAASALVGQGALSLAMGLPVVPVVGGVAIMGMMGMRTCPAVRCPNGQTCVSKPFKHIHDIDTLALLCFFLHRCVMELPHKQI